MVAIGRHHRCRRFGSGAIVAVGMCVVVVGGAQRHVDDCLAGGRCVVSGALYVFIYTYD